jgi:hypothetical protein
MLVVTTAIGVSTGETAGVAGVVTCGGRGAGDDCVQPADRENTIRRIRNPVPKWFIKCIVYG